MAQCQPQSVRSPFVRFARNGTPLADVMTHMKCNRRSAEKRLCEGRALLEGLSETEDTASPEALAAVSLLKSSGLAPTEISRRRWTEVALGLVGAV